MTLTLPQSPAETRKGVWQALVDRTPLGWLQL